MPETFAGLEQERFAFVLLDLDLYEPTRASLEFFYPRLPSGGCLAVHDYNNAESDWACRRALDGFLADKPERVVELADIMGTGDAAPRLTHREVWWKLPLTRTRPSAVGPGSAGAAA